MAPVLMEPASLRRVERSLIDRVLPLTTGGFAAPPAPTNKEPKRYNRSQPTSGRIYMKRAFMILALLLCLPTVAEPQGDSGPPADILAVRNIEITFHTAGSVLPNKDLELMMSLYADDAVLTDTAHDNKVYRGKEQVRAYWADVSGPFRPEHHWIGYTPAMRIESHVTGNTGTLDFECLWMNADDNTIGAHAFSSMNLARINGHWLVKAIKVGKADKL